jgi:N6-adenosine-specific RNA methylase IME4
MPKYHTVYADPPWNEAGGGKICRGANKHYPLMKTKDIMVLPVAELAEENAHLYLWVTNGKLPDGLKVMESWGFRYVTNIAWGKDRIGIGQYFRGKHELCLFGVRGNLPYRILPNGKRAQGETFFTAPRKKHSEKPERMREMIEIVSPGPYIELFARKKTPGWDVWGNEVQSDIVMPSNSSILVP